MKCVRCNNQDPNYFIKDQHGYYCLKCVHLSRIYQSDKIATVKLKPINQIFHYRCQNYPLSPIQQQLITNIYQDIFQHNILIHAACGAGKSDIAIHICLRLLNQAYKVAFVVTRTQVAIELYQKLSKELINTEVILVCENYHSKHDGDLIITTPQQLFRYHQAFDYLIIDEVDAFPFDDNIFLQTITFNSVKYHYLLMSATLSPTIKKKLNSYKVYSYYHRYHNRKLPLPQVIYCPNFLIILYLVILIKKYQNDFHLLIYFPTITDIKFYYHIFNRIFDIKYLYAGMDNKDQILTDFINNKFKVLFTSIILERGITIADAFVIVVKTWHHVFKEENLIQIAGRIDRALESYHAKVLFLTSNKTKKIKNVIKEIERMNHA